MEILKLLLFAISLTPQTLKFSTFAFPSKHNGFTGQSLSLRGGADSIGKNMTANENMTNSLQIEVKEGGLQDTSTSKERKSKKRQVQSKISSGNKQKQTGNTVLDSSIRRIRREWKDVVQLGVGYDWVKSETVIVRRRRSILRNEQEVDHILRSNDSSKPDEKYEMNRTVIDSDKNLNSDSFDSQNNHTEIESNRKDKTGSTMNKNVHTSTHDAEHQRQADDIRLGPLGKSLFIWHFSMAGAPGSSFDGGLYHGRVVLPKNYPGSPPRIMLLTPSGRFVVGQGK